MNKGIRIIGFLNFFACVLLGIWFTGCSQTSSISPVQKNSFIKYFGGGKDQQAGKVLQSADGGYVVVGSTNSYTIDGNYDQFVVKTDAYGNQLWSKTFGGKGNDFARDIKINPDGTGYVFVGDKTFAYPSVVSTNWSSLFNIRKISLNGDSLGSYYFGDTTLIAAPHGLNSGVSMALTNSNIYFSGYTNVLYAQTGITNVYIGKSDYSGNLVSNSVYGLSGGYSTVTGLFVDNTNRIFNSINIPTPDNANGVSIFSISESNFQGFNDIPVPALVAQNFGLGGIINQNVQTINDFKLVNSGGTGNVAFTGAFNGSLYVMLINQGLTLVTTSWTNIETGLSASYSEGKAIFSTSDGGFVVTGYFVNTANSNNGQDVFLIKLDASGKVSWSKSFGGTGNDEGVDVIQTTDGGYLISANIAFGTNNNVIGLIKVKSDGTLD